MSYLDDVLRQVLDWDADRPRTQQKELGWSNMADCRAYMGFRIRGDWPTNDEETWRAIAGTAMHDWLTELRINATAADVFDGKLSIGWNVETAYRGVLGHADEVDFTHSVVTDWKFPKLSSAKLFDDPAVLREKMVQPHGYAAGLLDRLEPPITVRLLVMPVDGKTSDWAMYEEEFNEAIPDAAIDRYEGIVLADTLGELLPRDRPYHFCKDWCEFFDACRGGYEPEGLEEITDPELATAIERYGLAREQESAARAVKDQMAEVIRGLRGKARGWQVTMTKPRRGKQVLDQDAVRAHYDAMELDLPKRWDEPGQGSLQVTRENR